MTLRRLVAPAVAVVACSGALVAKATLRSGLAAPLKMRTLSGSVVRMGSLHGRSLLGVRLRASVCSRSKAEAARTVPTSFRVAHYVTPNRTTSGWGKPFRVVENDVYWVVALGEHGNACNDLQFEDVIPPDNYGGAESSLGVLGYSTKYHCYGVKLTLLAAISNSDQRTYTPISASRRTIIQCGRFRPS
jgi:hypothetical protein